MRRWGIAAVVLGAFVLALVGPGSTQRAASATKVRTGDGKSTLTLSSASATCNTTCDISSAWVKDDTGQLRCVKVGIFEGCGFGTSTKYPAGSVVTLTAGADRPLKFRAWTGDCAFSGGGSCKLLMDSNKSVGVVYTT